MGRLTPYEPVLSGKALALLLSLKKRQQRRLIEALYRLAEYPHHLATTNRRMKPDGKCNICKPDRW